VGEMWAELRRLPRHEAGSLGRRQIPESAGIYVWFKDSEAVYLGKASSLRKRLGTHLGRSSDLSRSTLRRTVALRERGVPRAVSAKRPSVLLEADVEAVNAWIRSCEVAWLELRAPADAHAREAALLTEWRPPLNLA
jgi:hypothetical protein